MLKCRTALCSGVVVTDARTQHARTGTVKKYLVYLDLEILDKYKYKYINCPIPVLLIFSLFLDKKIDINESLNMYSFSNKHVNV